jgi:hypothetical protein
MLLNIQFFKKVSSILKEYGTGIPILGGDFNETMNQTDRKSASRKNTKPQQVSSSKTLIKSNKLTDIWRDLNENVQQFRISIFKTSHTSLLSIWLFSLFSICLSIKWLIKI